MIWQATYYYVLVPLVQLRYGICITGRSSEPNGINSRQYNFHETWEWSKQLERTLYSNVCLRLWKCYTLFFPERTGDQQHIKTSFKTTNLENSRTFSLLRQLKRDCFERSGTYQQIA